MQVCFRLLFTTTTLFQHTVTTLSLHKQIITSTTTSQQQLKSLLPPKIVIFCYFVLNSTRNNSWHEMTPLRPIYMVFEPEKLVLLMRSLNERAMGLNEEGKTKWRPKRVLDPWKILSRNRERRSSQSL